MSDKKYFLLIDVDLCQDCRACYLACKDEYLDNTFIGYSAPQPRHCHMWIRHPRKERADGSLMDIKYLPQPCMHCSKPLCASKAKNGAVNKRSDGIVLIDPVKAKNQSELVASCPYGAIAWNEEANLPQKCTLCAHLLDEGWNETRCSQICPSGAIKLMHITDGERAELIAKEKLEAYKPELKTEPTVLYKNLFRFTKGFIAGSVAATKDGVVDCVNGATVNLSTKGGTVAELTTDNYGDFKFDNLPEDSGGYILSIDAGSRGSKRLTIDFGKSVYLADIML